MISSRTALWLLLASLLVLQVLAELEVPAEDEHALDRSKRAAVPLKPSGYLRGNKLAKKSAAKTTEKRKLKPKSTKRFNADRNRRNKKEHSKKSSRRQRSN